MSFLQRLFGGGGAPKAAAPTAETTHNGYRILAIPMEEGGQYWLSGIISKEIGGETREHRLIRADVFSDPDSAADATLEKAKRVIDEQGERLFSD